MIIVLWVLLLGLCQPVWAQTTHRLDPTPTTVTRGYYSASALPALTVRSGDSIDVATLIPNRPDLLEKYGVPPNQIQPASRRIHAETKPEPGLGPHILTGPVFVQGAERGDAIEVELVSIELVIPYAVNFHTGDHILRSEFANTSVRVVPLDLMTREGRFSQNVILPLRPFFGSIGLAPPAEMGKIPSGPPGVHGGNFDNKELVAGSRVFLPVHVAGGLLFIGDGHAGQGNGEVNGSGLETSLNGRIRVTLHKQMALTGPRAETPTHFMTMGLHRDLDEAARIATSEMVAFLVVEKKLSRDDAYHLCSVAGDLSVTQVVDGTKGVHMMMPKSIFK